MKKLLLYFEKFILLEVTNWLESNFLIYIIGNWFGEIGKKSAEFPLNGYVTLYSIDNPLQ